MAKRIVTGPDVPVDQRSANHRTVESYERIAREYAEETAPGPDGRSSVVEAGLRRLVEAMPEGGTALEVGSGPGWDADFVESLGGSVRRTDVTDAFIEFQVARGKSISKLDVITDDFGGPFDAVIALAVLQHVARDHIASVLVKVAEALHPHGTFLVTVLEGAGEGWEVGDSGNRYYVVRWSAMEFQAHLTNAGMAVEWSARSLDSEGSRWMTLLARKISAATSTETSDGEWR
jgi:hypothetical protein